MISGIEALRWFPAVPSTLIIEHTYARTDGPIGLASGNTAPVSSAL